MTTAALLPRGLWFRTGPATLLVRPRGWYLLVPTASKAVHDAAWSVLADPPSAEDLRATVAREAGLESVGDLPPMLAALGDGPETSVVLQGQTPLKVYAASGAEMLVPEDEEQLVRAFTDAHRIGFGTLPAEDSSGGLQILEGAARVRGFTQMLVDPGDLDPEQRRALAEAVAHDDGSIESPEDRAAREKAEKEREERRAAQRRAEEQRGQAAAQQRATASPPRPRPAAPARPAADDAGPNIFADLFASPAGDAKEADATHATAAPEPDAAEGSGGPAHPQRRRRMGTSLFDRRPAAASRTHGTPPQSAHRPEPQPEPVPSVAEETQIPVDDGEDAPESADPQAPEAGSEGSSTYDDLFGTTIIRSVADAAVHIPEDDEDEQPTDAPAQPAAPAAYPAAAEAPSPAAPQPTPPQPATWPDGERRQSDTASSVQPTVPARTCPAGHHNSPERSTCRICGAPLDARVSVVARPVRGIVEISTGEQLALDRGMIIGRRPRASRVSGQSVPQLITVPSPYQDISRSHVELRLEGWSVIAQDLDTTNGTVLLREGEEPRRLRPLQDTPLMDGDVLDLGDGIMIRWWDEA